MFIIEEKYKNLSNTVMTWSENKEELKEEISDKNINFVKEDIKTFDSDLENYLKSPQKFNYFYKDSNPRNDFTKTLSWENLIKSYFVFWNNWLYRDSCSLLSKNKCNTLSKWLYVFEDVFKKTYSWYEDISITKSLKDENIYCVKYKYKLKYDTSNEYIEEVFNYNLNKKNWNYEISNRYCEQIKKWDRNIKCPFTLKNYYCK